VCVLSVEDVIAFTPEYPDINDEPPAPELTTLQL